MHWIVLLGIVVLVILVPALTGSKPEGTRRVAGTRLMMAARVFLGLLAILFLALALRSYGVL